MNKKEKNSVMQIYYKYLLIFNVIFIGFLVCYYGYRTVHYYDLEHNKYNNKVYNLVETITKEQNIVYAGDGLYPDGEGYRYIGKNVNNYLSYSGMLWRIIKVNDDDSLTLITEDNMTSLVWGKDTNVFTDSYIYEWLNPKEGITSSGYFYNHLSNPKNFLVNNKTCIDILDKPKEQCAKTYDKALVGLLSASDYLAAGGTNSYLNTSTYFWMSNGSNDGKIWYVFDKGGFNNLSSSGDNYYSYGVRPVITINGKTALKGGNGTIDNPYTIESLTYKTLNTVGTGIYVTYQDKLWRVVDSGSDKVKIVLEDVLKNGDTPVLKAYSPTTNKFDPSSWNNIGYYLNNTYISDLNLDMMVKGPWYTGPYNTDTGFDYKRVYDNSVESYVGLLHMGELFLHDAKGYATLTSSNDYENTVITVNSEGMIYSETNNTEVALRPAIYLRGDLTVTGGVGTKQDPLTLGGAA